MSIAANNTCRQAVSWALALSLGWLTACAPQPGAVPPLQKPNTSAPANASAALLRQQHPQHPNPNHPSNRRALQQRQLLPAYFIELNVEYQGFSTLALTASYLERKVRTLIANNDGEALRREIDFARYKHPQLLINIMLADPSLYTAAAAMPEVVAFRSVSAPFDAYMQQLAGENTDVQEFRVNTSLGYHRYKSIAMNAQGQSVVVWEAAHMGSQAPQQIYAQRYDSQGLPDGPEFQVNTQAERYNLGWLSTSVAMGSTGDFVVTWHSFNSSGINVYARRYNNQGQALGAEFQVNTNTEINSRPSSIAMDGEGNFVISWVSQNAGEKNIFARRYDNQGQALGAEFEVAAITEGYAFGPNVAMDAGGDFLVTWVHYDYDWSRADIMLRRYASNGTAHGTVFQVNTLPAQMPGIPTVAVDGQGDFVVAWTAYSEDWYDGNIFARRYTSNGTPQGVEFQINSTVEGVHTIPSVAMEADGDFVVSWTRYDEDWKNPQIHARRYTSNALPQSPDFRVNTSSAYDHRYPMVAIDGEGNFNIAWTRYESGWPGLPSDIYAMRYNAAGQPQPALSPLPERDLRPEFRVNTYTSNHQSRPNIAMDDDGNFVVVWHSQGGQDGDGSGIYAQRYDANGTPQGTEFQVNTLTTNDQRYPAVAMDADGDFVITWSTGTYGTFAQEVYAQRYNAQGIPQGSEFRVCTNTGWNKRSDVAMDASGNMVVTWDGGGSGDLQNVYARRYNAQGQSLGEIFRVNTHTTGLQLRPNIAMNSGGDFVIVWDSTNGGLYGNFAQRYDANGNSQGPEFQVNTYMGIQPQSPAIAMAETGAFAITWTYYSNWPERNIYARRYDEQGQVLGAEFQVNTEMIDYQYEPAIAMSPVGDFVITWTASSGYAEIYAQCYDAQGQAQGGETQLNLTRNNSTESAVVMNTQGDFVATWSGGSNIWARLFDSQGQPK